MIFRILRSFIWMNAKTEPNRVPPSPKKRAKEIIGDIKKIRTKKNSSQKLRKTNFEKDVVYLYQFSRTPLLPSLSCYCLKVETWLRLAGLKYENVDHKMKYRSSKGQLPFVEVNGEHLADSDVIISELSNRYNCDLNAALTPEQRSISHAITLMLDNHFAWVVMWWRSKHPSQVIKGYKVDLQHALGTRVPKSILNFFFRSSFRRKGKKKVRAQGMANHSQEEIIELGQKDLDVLVNLLGDKPYIFETGPTTLDATLFAHLAQVYFIDEKVHHPLREYLMKYCHNLVGHVTRIKAQCYPDWDQICKTMDLNTHLHKTADEGISKKSP